MWAEYSGTECMGWVGESSYKIRSTFVNSFLKSALSSVLLTVCGLSSLARGQEQFSFATDKRMTDHHTIFVSSICIEYIPYSQEFPVLILTTVSRTSIALLSAHIYYFIFFIICSYCSQYCVLMTVMYRSVVRPKIHSVGWGIMCHIMCGRLVLSVCPGCNLTSILSCFSIPQLSPGPVHPSAALSPSPGLESVWGMTSV